MSEQTLLKTILTRFIQIPIKTDTEGELSNQKTRNFNGYTKLNDDPKLSKQTDPGGNYTFASSPIKLDFSSQV